MMPCAGQIMNKNYGFVKNILGEEYADIVAQRYQVARGVEAYVDLCLNNAIIICG